MEILLIDRGETAELILNGGLDVATADQTLQYCSRVPERFRNVIVELSGLRYISSAGLDVIKQLYMRINQAGGKLELRNASPTMMEVLEMTGFTSFLRITQSPVLNM